MGDYTKRRKIFNYLKKQVSCKEVVFWQETHSVQKDEKIWTNQFGCGQGSIVFSHGKSDAAFREGLKYKVRAQCVDDNGRYIVLDARFDSNPAILVNYYAPNVETDQMKVLDEITHIFDKIEISGNTTLIWGGDFNLFFNINLDADGSSPELKVKSVSKLLSMMLKNDLCDIYRIRNPQEKRFTWRRKTPFKERRLDFFLVSDMLQDNIRTVDIVPSVQSDHSAIILKLFPTSECAQGRAYWKFNSSLAQDKHFTESLETEIQAFVREGSSLADPIMRWEYISRKFSIKMSKERKARRLALEKRLANLERLISSNSIRDFLEEYSKCKSDLESLYNYITAGVILGSKSEWYEHGEKFSKYFLNLEKSNMAKSHIRKQLTSSDVEISKPPDIMNHIKEFYASLHKQRSKTEQDCQNIYVISIYQSECESYEGLLAKRMCWNMLNSMKNN